MRFLPAHLPAIHLLAILGIFSHPARALDISVTPVVGDTAVTGPASFRNGAGEHWTVTRLSYLLSEPALRREDGTWHECGPAPAWLSLGDGRSRWSIPRVPEGRWTGLRFSVGLPPALNESDPAAWAPDHPLNPNLNGLHWSWQGGYIHLALEGRFWRDGDDREGAPGFAYHIARESFRTTIIVPVEFTTSVGDTGGPTISLALDLGKLLDGPPPVSFVRDGSSTHSKKGDPLAATLSANLRTAFRIADRGMQSLEGASAAPAPGTFGRADGLFLPPAFPKPALPSDLAASPTRIQLGRQLFHETALSRSNELSCASCHRADNGLSDPRPVSLGEGGRSGSRNSMPLFNLAWRPSFFWDGRAASLRDQVLEPIEDHRELDENLDDLALELAALPGYEARFSEAFGDARITPERLGIALETFLLTLVSHDSKFDRARRGEDTLNELEQRGFELFMTEREPRSGQFGGDCFHCHGGPLFTDHLFRNNGLPIDPADPGRGTVTGLALDRGTFSTPSLRNIALTAPYMHDGRFDTLEEVLDHYSEGVERTSTIDANLAKHPDGGLALSEDEKAALIAFLRTLTDDRYVRDAYQGSE